MKRLVVPIAALSLTAITQVGCIYVPPPQRAIAPEAPAYPADVSEQYRPLPPPSPAQETVEVTSGPDIQINEFQEQLAPYGHWVTAGEYGGCWVPAGVAGGWRPYTLGHWVYTDSGLAWVSDEPWGWATYHYGRWVLVEGIGWAWAPASQWAPAWVAWRDGGGYCGWAPLPPVGLGEAQGFGVNDEAIQAIAPACFCFCDERYITAGHIYQQCLPPDRNITIITRTTNITKITMVNNRVVNRSWDSARLQQAIGRPVQPVPVHEAASVEELAAAHPRTVHPPEQHQRPDAPSEPLERASPQADPQLRAAYDAQVRSIEQSYAQQRAQMSQRFAMERRQRPPGPGADDLASRQDAQMKDLEKRHQQELAEARRKYHQ